MTDFETFYKKAKQQLGYLHQYFYENLTSIMNLEIASDTREDRRTVFSDDEPNWKLTQLGAHWSGRDDYYWLRFTLKLPEFSEADLQFNEAPVSFMLHTHLGRTGAGGNSGFEGLIYINNQIIQGVDSNHQDLYLDAGTYSGTTLKFKILLWTGLEGGGQPQTQYYTLDELSAGLSHPAIEETYNYLNNIAGVIRELDDDTPIKYEYCRLLQESFNQLNWLDTNSVDQQCKLILSNIHNFIKAHPNQKVPYTVTAVGHTHIDVAWLWRLRHTREKITRSFSTVLKLQEEFPDYQFFQSTPQDYAFLEQDHPELAAKIAKRVAEGRWEANGATWLEPDTNIPSGESLTRQFLYGGKFFKEHFNSRQNVLWLPDVFGYSAALPQIMQGFNISNFMTTKISWNDTNRMPHDTFWWEGIDGSQVLTHFITTVDANGEHQNEGNWAYTYNGDITPHTVFGSYLSRGTLFRHPFVTLFRPETTLFRRTNVTFLIFNLVIRQIIPSVGLEY